jgi:hypothetical protein
MNGGAGTAYNGSINTTSYAKAMQDSQVSAKVDEAAAPVTKSRDQVLAQLRDQHAIGVVVAVRGQIVWADLFASTDLLSRYWTKLVRSYAAESLTEGETHAAPTVADAEHFLDAPTGGTETSEGDVGVYRYRELRAGVHISKMRLQAAEHGSRTPQLLPQPPRFAPPGPFYPEPRIYR